LALAEFEALWINAMGYQRRSLLAAKEQRLAAVAASFSYLISGRKAAA